MAQIAHRLRRIVDKEWIRVGWAGMPTLRHHLIAFAPVAILLIPSMIVEQRSYETGAAVLFVGFLIYGAMMIWIHLRRMAGLGFFSSARSDRIAKRHQRRGARLSTSVKADWDGNGS